MAAVVGKAVEVSPLAVNLFARHESAIERSDRRIVLPGNCGLEWKFEFAFLLHQHHNRRSNDMCVRFCRLLSNPLFPLPTIEVNLRRRAVASERASSIRRSACRALSHDSCARFSAAVICALCAAICASISAFSASFCDLKSNTVSHFGWAEWNRSTKFTLILGFPLVVIESFRPCCSFRPAVSWS